MEAESDIVFTSWVLHALSMLLVEAVSQAFFAIHTLLDGFSTLIHLYPVTAMTFLKSFALLRDNIHDHPLSMSA
jgi:hypothetical protein